MAITLSKEGYTVVAGMRGKTGKNKSAAEELSELTGVEVVEIDVTNDDSVNKAFEETISKFGNVDVLVNNAAVSGFGLLEAYNIN